MGVPRIGLVVVKVDARAAKGANLLMEASAVVRRTSAPEAAEGVRVGEVQGRVPLVPPASLPTAAEEVVGQVPP